MATLHVRNVPDALYEALRAQARERGRSINAETIAVLERALVARRTVSLQESLRRAAELRAEQERPGNDFDVVAAIRAGRENH